ncbi:hypothetical protein KHQ88_01590 [Mycoplasmatota bacterium]|nr:hypothetical protein KHQ88_01590 [Mycoplasmatota bacterium]
MEIDHAILKHYLRNVYFINGTSYAGKSTICKMISDRLGLIHCGENYNHSEFLKLADSNKYPNINYFKTMKNWEEFVSRTPKEYSDWLVHTARELVPFELIELISLSRNQKVIVDTNLPVDVLKKIADDDHVAILLADEDLAVNEFFNRSDPEKKFILEKINKTKNPEETLNNYRESIRKANNQEVIAEYEKSGFKCFWRTKDSLLEDRYKEVIRHFKLI